MAGNAQELIIRLKIEDGTYKASLQKAEKATDAFAKAAKASGEKTKRSFTEINQAVELASKGFRLLEGSGQLLFSTLDQAQKVQGVAKGFELLQTQADQLATGSLANLRVATRGLVDDYTLMQQANQAAALGLDVSKLDSMAEAATKLGAAVGRTANEAFSDLITGVGRASPLILDNLGITIKASEAQEKYAAANNLTVASLTEVQKAEAFRELAIGKISEKAAELADIERNAATASQQLGAAVTNASNSFSTGFASSDQLTSSLSGLSTIINDVDMEPLAKGLADVAGYAVLGASKILEFLGVLDMLPKSNAAVTESISKQYQSYILFAHTIEDVQATHEKFARLQLEQKKRISDLEKEQIKLNKAFKESETAYNAAFGPIVVKAAERMKKLKAELEANKVALEREEIALEQAGKAADLLAQKFVKLQNEERRAALAIGPTNDELKKQKDELDKLNASYRDLIRATEEKSLKDAMDAALKAGNLAQFDALEKRLADVWFRGTVDGMDRAVQSPDNLAAVKRNAEVAAGLYGAATQDALKDPLQESADFFADALYNSMTGKSFDFEDMFKRFAAGFAGQIMAEMTGGFAGGFGDLQGFGKEIAQGIMSESGLSEAIKGAASGGSTAAGASGALSLSSLGPAVAAMLAPLVVENSISGAGSVLEGGRLSFAEQTALALPTFGFSYAYNPVADMLGISSSGKGADERGRDSVRDRLREPLGDDLSFASFGRGGSTSLYHDIGEDGPESELAERMMGISSVISDALGGGDSGYENVFSHAISDAEDYNHALASTAVFLQEIGMNAESLSEPLKQAFLSGELALNDFGSQLQDVNDLQNANLEGVGNVDAALQLLAESYDDPQKQMFALEALFNELEETGLSSLSEMGAALEEKLGPEARAVFEKLEEQGISSFRNIEDASADEVFAIFSGMNDIRDDVTSTFGAIGDATEDTKSRMRELQSQNEDAERSVRNLTSEVKNLRLEMERLGRTPIPAVMQ